MKKTAVKRRHFKHITERERYAIETMLKCGRNVCEIAKELNRSRSTIYAEIKRGTVRQRNSELIEKDIYLADYAQMQGYGLSEASPVVAVNRGKHIDMKSIGYALESFEAVTDETTGELLLRGPSVMKGYYKQEDLTAEVIDAEGWLHTGDIAHIDPKTKNIYITGRIKNMIVLSGGKKVFPEEVEAVLEQSTNFAEVCVMGMKREFGEKDGCEEIAAIIVPTPDYAANFSDPQNLEDAVTNEVKFLSSRLAHYKRPIKIIVHTELLPRTTTRKLKRMEIKKMLCEMSS